MHLVIHDRGGDLFDHLLDPIVPRLCPRVQCVANRRRDFLDGCGLTGRCSRIHPAGAQTRYPLAHDVWPGTLQSLSVELQFHHSCGPGAMTRMVNWEMEMLRWPTKVRL